MPPRIGVYRVPRAGLEAWLGVHIILGLFVVVAASTGVLALALVPWGVRGLYEAPAIEQKACPPAMGGEPPRAIKHPAAIDLGSPRAPVTVVGEVGCQRDRDYTGKEVDTR